MEANEQAKIEVGGILRRAWTAVGHEGRAAVKSGLRDLAKRKGRNPDSVALELGASWDMPEPTDEAKAAMAEALAHVWYKFPPHSRSAVFQAAREVAMLAGENLDEATMVLDAVLDGARTAGEALSEQRAASAMANERRRQERLRKEAAAELKRLLRA